jgi:VanZ family protein
MPERSLAVVPAWRWWAGVLLIATVAGYTTVLAYQQGLPEIFAVVWQFDKAVHFSAAGLLAFFLDGALKRRMLMLPRLGGLSIPLAAAMVLVPAGIEEFLQRYSIARTSSIWDFAADVAGVAILVRISRRVAQ